MKKSEEHRRLAIIYLSPGNPNQDHNRAITELGKYLNLQPEDLDRATAASWAKAIESAKEFEQTRRKISQLEKKNRSLSKTVDNLKEQNNRLEKTIGQLKDLDLNLEKKRKSLQ